MPTMVTLVNGTVPVADDFNNNFTALNNAIGSSTAISAWSTGEMPYASAANTLSRLTPGVLNQVLRFGATTPAWGNTPSIGGCFLSNNGSDATNDIDISVGARWSDDAAFASRAYMSLTSGYTKQLDAAWAVGTNQGMRDTGAIANGTWHIFLIRRPDTGVVDVLASASATAPTMPASYTQKWRIGSILREAATIVPFTQFFTLFRRKASAADISATNPGTSAVTRTLSVPVGINVLAVVQSWTTTGITTLALLSDLDVTDVAATQGESNYTSIATLTGQVRDLAVKTNTSAQIRSRLSASDASVTLNISTLGWVDPYILGNV